MIFDSLRGEATTGKWGCAAAQPYHVVVGPSCRSAPFSNRASRALNVSQELKAA